MELAGLSLERGARSSATRASTGTLDRRPRAVRSESADPVASAPDLADRQQADYFLHLLTARRRLIEHRIDEYQKAMLNCEANGDADGACNARRMMRIEEQDRQTLDGMIEKLCRRFPRRVPGEAPATAARTRFVAR
jgi:hypothetical protein